MFKVICKISDPIILSQCGPQLFQSVVVPIVAVAWSSCGDPFLFGDDTPFFVTVVLRGLPC